MGTIGTNAIVVTHCCATMTSDNISATMTYVKWREEHLGRSVYSKEYTYPILFTIIAAEMGTTLNNVAAEL
jgi:hypothetical protein